MSARSVAVRRLAILLPCLAVLGWVWWASQADGYTGLPVNTLGQIIGDLLLAAIAGPVALGYRLVQYERARPIGDLPGRLARARHRIQLLDTTGCLLSWSEIPVRDASRAELEQGRDRLVAALRAALERDVAVEILLPPPGLAQSRGVPRALGLTAGAHRELAEDAETDLAALHDAVPAGRLDIRCSRSWPAVALVRCDNRMWAWLRPDGMPDAGPLCLEFSARSRNARVLAAHFNELHRFTARRG